MEEPTGVRTSDGHPGVAAICGRLREVNLTRIEPGRSLDHREFDEFGGKIVGLLAASRGSVPGTTRETTGAVERVEGVLRVDADTALHVEVAHP